MLPLAAVNRHHRDVPRAGAILGDGGDPRRRGAAGSERCAAPVAVALCAGGLAVAVLDPIVAAHRAAIRGAGGPLPGARARCSRSRARGLWLRQGDPSGQTVIHASAASLDGTVLSGVTFVTFDPEEGPARRIEARRAELVPGAWAMTEAKDWPLLAPNPEAAARAHEALRLPTDLTRDQIRDSFGDPSGVSIWELPAFIEALDAAGFSARAHRMWLQAELASPLFMAAMVMAGAAFTMRHTRAGRTGPMVLGAVLTGCALYFLRDFASILGANGEAPVWLAAWAPPVAASALAAGLLLHLERRMRRALALAAWLLAPPGAGAGARDPDRRPRRRGGRDAGGRGRRRG